MTHPCYAILTVELDGSFNFQVYLEPLFSSPDPNNWRIVSYDSFGSYWIYDFTYMPSFGEVLHILDKKLKEMFTCNEEGFNDDIR